MGSRTRMKPIHTAKNVKRATWTGNKGGTTVKASPVTKEMESQIGLAEIGGRARGRGMPSVPSRSAVTNRAGVIVAKNQKKPVLRSSAFSGTLAYTQFCSLRL